MNPVAYESYLKGRYFWNKRTADGLKVALAYFNEAIDEDPKYAQAYSGLADTYALLGDWQYAVMTPKEALPKAKAAAIKALELDSALGEAHTSLAFCLDGFDWDFDVCREGIPAGHRTEPRLRDRSPLVCVAFGSVAPVRRSDRGNEKGGKPRSALSHHQRRSGRAPGHCAFLRRIDTTEPQDDRNGSGFWSRAQSPRPGVPPETHER